MANGETVDRILRAATILFAERGFAETSLRTITGMADVNLAAVNYHFGSKKALIQAVFAQFLRPLCREIESRLDDMTCQLGPQQQPEIEPLLKILIDSVIAATSEVDQKPQRFMRLLNLAYTQTQDHLRIFMSDHFGATHRRFIELLRQTTPELGPLPFYWRLNFCLGASLFSLGELESITALLEADEAQQVDVTLVTKELVPALVGMFQSDNKLS